jgi:hypothetical protein
LDPLRFDFHLTANSPCIDAGDPENQPDPDGTIADIGAFYYQQGPLIIQNLTITIQGNDIYLDWQDMSGATLYHIYRSNTPYFDITGVTPLANSTVSSYVDAGALVDRVWFYRVSWE